MKAVWYEKFGEAREVLKLGELEVPTLAPGELLVRVSHSGVNPSDVKRRRGSSAVRDLYPKIVPHNDGSGIVEAVGDSSLDSRVGERVWIYEAQLNRAYGTAAQYVVVPSELAVPLPASASLELGASLGVPAMTAHRCVFSDGPVKGLTVLITGGAGAVGNFAVQFAKWGGAEVIATVSSKEKATVARRARADHIINYKEEDVAARVLEITGKRGVDRIVEVALGTNLGIDLHVLRNEGVIAAYASDALREPLFPFYSAFQKNVHLFSMLVYSMSREAHKAAIVDITSCLQENYFLPHLSDTFTLEEIVLAHEAVESSMKTGKVLVKI